MEVKKPVGEQKKLLKNSIQAQLTTENVVQDYNCNKCCRICPFPGLKCVINQETWRRIK